VGSHGREKKGRDVLRLTTGLGVWVGGGLVPAQASGDAALTNVGENGVLDTVTHTLAQIDIYICLSVCLSVHQSMYIEQI
jgi:hypothetical protein